MASDATIRRVSRPRGDLTPRDAARLAHLMEKWRATDAENRSVIVGMIERSSFRAVSEVTGLSTNTLQRWKREAGR